MCTGDSLVSVASSSEGASDFTLILELPFGFQKRLREAAVGGDIVAIINVVEEIGLIDVPLGLGLRDMAQSYDADGMLELFGDE